MVDTKQVRSALVTKGNPHYKQFQNSPVLVGLKSGQISLNYADTIQEGIDQLGTHYEVIMQMLLAMTGQRVGDTTLITGFEAINPGRANSVCNVEIKNIFVTENDVTVYYNFEVKNDGTLKHYEVRISYFANKERKKFQLEAYLITDRDLEFPIEMDMSSFEPLIWYAFGALANCSKS
jgi:hypothetical protein